MNNYRFHKKCDLQRSTRTGGFLAHMKFTLSDRDDEDVVACLIVRQRVPASLPADELENLVHGHALHIEDTLRQTVETLHLFDTD